MSACMLERWGESVPHKDYVPAAHPDVCYSSRNGPYRTSLRFSELFIFFSSMEHYSNWRNRSGVRLFRACLLVNKSV